MSWLNNLWQELMVKPAENITGVTAANLSTDAMLESTQMGIDEQRRQFDIMQGNMSPYTEAGAGAIQQQQALSGALGPEAQQQAYDSIQNSPGFQAALQQGETSILQNAAATGGVRGGNTQGAMAQFSPQLLGQAIDQRYNQLGGLAGMGQASAAGVGAAGMGMGQGIAGSLQNMGQANASNIMGQYGLKKNFAMDMVGMFTNFMGAKG